MLFATKDQSRPIFKAEDTWRFLVEQGKRFYRSSSCSSSNGNGDFFQWLIKGVHFAPLVNAMAAAYHGLEKVYLKRMSIYNNLILFYFFYFLNFLVFNFLILVLVFLFLLKKIVSF
jgi:hypothetical protein